jgi:CBS domain-containing protein
MKARDITTHPARTVREDCTLESAARTMLAHNIGCLPVTDGAGKLVGILTESDFAGKEKGVPFSLFRFPQVFGDWLPNQGVEKMYAAARSRRVGEFMSRAVATVDIADDIEAVIAKMQKTGFHRLPVVVDGQPDGIIARHDLLRLMQVRLAEGERT